ncbi:hypothetical protein COU60_05225 [Candidatus Pacearchaeota archaeon CG10_big_fil_rev_8_21_14_0_10_34_76]|nr:MAG: hypothetical protein COU60_05225 [Candidatus Pacearchaeota archaeon CG10_big_fil_rev_8_21_14_0_10_34_76]
MRTKISDLDKIDENQNVDIKGRVIALRKHEKTVFLDVEDETGKYQVLVERSIFDSSPIRVGDILNLEGHKFKTGTNHPSLQIREYNFLVRPVDYMTSDSETRELILDRANVENTISSFFRDRGVIKVDTKVLSEYSGSSDIIPFKTSHRGKKDHFLRFTMELELKKLVAKTQMPLFEIGHVFRNLGKSNRRSIEYTSCEACIPYLDFEEGITMAENLFKTLAQSYGKEIGEIPRVSIEEICKQLSGKPNFELTDDMKKIYKKQIKKMDGPIIVASPPGQWTSPLYVQDENGTARDSRFLYGGLGTIIQVCEESTDYDRIVRSISDQQERLRSTGRESSVDPSFLDAMRSGLPPSIGIHISLDRFLMAFRDENNIGRVKI